MIYIITHWSSSEGESVVAYSKDEKEAYDYRKEREENNSYGTYSVSNLFSVEEIRKSSERYRK